jgi:hypothetical protein
MPDATVRLYVTTEISKHTSRFNLLKLVWSKGVLYRFSSVLKGKELSRRIPGQERQTIGSAWLACLIGHGKHQLGSCRKLQLKPALIFPCVQMQKEFEGRTFLDDQHGGPESRLKFA